MYKQKGGPSIITPAEFAQLSTLITTQVNFQGGNSFVDNGQKVAQLPQVGLGQAMYLVMELTFQVTGTITGGAFAGLPNPVPHCAVKNIDFSANAGNVKLRSHTGWDLYTHNRYRHLIDFQSTGANDTYATNAQASLGITGSNRPVAGALPVSGTVYTLNMMMPVPFSYNRAGETALIKLQNESVYQLTVQCGNLAASLGATGGTSDLIVGLTGSGLTYAVTGTMYLTLDYFKWLPQPVQGMTPQQLEQTYDYSSQLGTVMSVLSSTFPLTGGLNVFQLLRNDWYTMALFRLINNGAAVSDANIQQITLQHSNNVVLSQSDRYTQLMKDYMLHDGRAPMDGVIALDFGLLSGLPQRRDTLQAINDQDINNLAVGVQLPTNLSLTNPICQCITEALVEVAA